MNFMHNCYDLAKKICHENGFNWTDPRTGETHKAPKKKAKRTKARKK